MGFLDNFRAKKTGQSALPTMPTVALYEEQATSQMVRLLTKVPDPDEVLKQAGIRREHLRKLLTDDEIAQACETRLDAVLATPFRLEPSEGPSADFLYSTLNPVLNDLVSACFQARLFGYSVVEAVYGSGPDGKVIFKFIGEKPFEWFEPKSDGRLMFYPDDGSGGSTGIEVEQQYKFFLTRSRPTYRQPYGEALLSKLYWPWFFRKNGWQFWAKFLERFGSPLLVGKTSDPDTMVKALLMAHTQAVMGIDREDSVEAVGASANSGQAFDGFEAAIIRRIQKVILGQTLTSGTDNSSGSRALGQVHDSVRTDKRNSDLQLVKGTLQRVVDALCELNKLPKHEVIFADDVGLEVERAARDKDLYALGVRFERSYFQDNYNLRIEDFSLAAESTPNAQPETPTPEAPIEPADTAEKQHLKASFLFSQKPTEGKFTPNQQVIEGLADSALQAADTPLGSAVKQVVLAATSPEDLEDRLFSLIGDKVSAEQFRAMLERSLYAADVIGYVHATQDGEQ